MTPQRNLWSTLPEPASLALANTRWALVFLCVQVEEEETFLTEARPDSDTKEVPTMQVGVVLRVQQPIQVGTVSRV